MEEWETYVHDCTSFYEAYKNIIEIVYNERI